MLQIFQQGDLTDSRAGNAIVLFLQADLLDGHKFTSFLVERLVYHTICSFSQLFKFLIFLQLWDGLGQIASAWEGTVYGSNVLAYLLFDVH